VALKSPDVGTLCHVMAVLSDGVLNRCDPLGARCIMGALEHVGDQIVALLEDRLMPREEIVDRISDLQPSVVWISVQPDTKGIATFAASVARSVSAPLVFGNVGARFLTAQDFEGISSDVFVVLGQGEDATIGLAHYFKARRAQCPAQSLHSIPNLRVFTRQESFQTVSAPSSAAKWIVPSAKFLRAAVLRNDVLTARSSSGCDAHCVFCTVRAINNGQRWRSTSTETLRAWLQRMVDAGLEAGKIGLVDDDLAGSLDNLKAVAQAFSEVNRINSTKLQFGFSTRAAHLVNPDDSPAECQRRDEAWEFVVASGLEGLFLGLESGSRTQLKRLGKGYPADMNFVAVSRAKRLGINLEIGFIPIDPFMRDGDWRQEMSDNLRLARHCDVALRSPTWLAPARAYRESPLAKWLSQRGLLGPEIPETGEYIVRYGSREVRQFISDLGPCLCVGVDNGLYRFKRELKYIQRYPLANMQRLARMGRRLIESELDFVERLLSTARREDVLGAQVQFIGVAQECLAGIEEALSADPAPHATSLRRDIDEAEATLSRWESSIAGFRRNGVGDESGKHKLLPLIAINSELTTR
jgi:radical SAM superfamily enzyme YgiQ (UPF0313 family)